VSIQHLRHGRPAVAAILAVALQAVSLPSLAGSSPATLHGRVVSGGAPMAGVKVHAGDPRTGKIYTSAPAAEDGTFRVAALPASAYELAVETPRGLFVVANGLSLAAGQERTVQLALQEDPPPPDAPAPSPEEVEAAQKRQRLGLWNNPLTATLIVVGAAVVVGFAVDQLTDDDDEPAASAFTLP
jgi:hypothetical protein